MLNMKKQFEENNLDAVYGLNLSAESYSNTYEGYCKAD